MEKSILLILALSIFSLTANAQIKAQKPLHFVNFGIRSGANFFNWGGAEPGHDLSFKEGFHAGVYGNMFLTDEFSVEPGIYYSLQGTRFGLRSSSRATLHYIDLPVLARYFVTDAFNVFAGPQVSYLLSSTLEGDFFDPNGRSPEDINTVDAGIILGVGYKFHWGVNAQISYDLGLIPVFNDNLQNLYNRGFKLSIGYNFLN